MDKNTKKKKVTVTVIGLIVAIAAVLIFTTYAYWQVTEKQSERNRLGSACLSITFTNENNDINLPSMYPTSQSEIMDDEEYPPYEFTITNTCQTLVNYTVALESIEDEQTQSNEYLNYDYVSVMLDYNGGSIYSGLDVMPNDTDPNLNYTIRDTKKLVTRRLAGGASRTHKLKIWLDENTPYQDENGLNTNKYFFGKIKIIAGQGINEECYAVNSEGVLYSYDPDCGKIATIPATVDGKQVRTISSDAFKGEIREYETETSSKMNGNSCRDISGTYIPCTKDFALVFSDRVADVLLGRVIISTPEEGEEFARSITPDDFYMIKYSTSTTGKYEYLDESMQDYYENFAESSNLTIPYSAIRKYTYGVDRLPYEGGLERYGAIDFEKSGIEYLSPSQVGSKSFTGNYRNGLAIESLDLSQATNLEKIEQRAFSNYPDVTNMSLNDLPSKSDVETGLTSLTFGSNSRNIVLEQACFAKALLNNLTIYNTYSMPNYNFNGHTLSSGITPSELFSAYNPFAYSDINNLTINQAGNDSTFSLYANIDTDISGTDASSRWASYMMLQLLNETNVTNLSFGNGFTRINFTPFINIQTLSLPSGLLAIGNGAFAANDTFTELSLPSTLTSIGEGAFGSWVGSGINLTIPSSVTTIGNEAFRNKTGVITVGSSSLVDTKSDWAPNATVTQ